MSYTVYEERYLAFLDVLGFSEIVSRLEPDDPNLDWIVFLLNTRVFAESTLQNPPAEFRSTSFSDNVVVSAPISPSGLEAVLHFSFQFAWLLLIQGGYLCR